MLAKIPVRMTVDEFLEWDPEDGRADMSLWTASRAPASTIHGFLQNELADLLVITCAIKQVVARWPLILSSFLGFYPSRTSGFRIWR